MFYFLSAARVEDQDYMNKYKLISLFVCEAKSTILRVILGNVKKIINI